MYEREVLVRWMEKKAELLGCPEYFTEEDRKELEEWDEYDVKMTFNTIDGMMEGRTGAPLSVDSSICPWCIHIKVCRAIECAYCGYGERHGICWMEGSLYQRLRGVAEKILLARPIGKRNLPSLWREVKGGADEV